VAEDDNEASDLILEDLKGTILTDHWGRVWLKIGPIWVSDTPVVENAIKLMLLRSGISRRVDGKNGKFSTRPYTQNISACEAVCKAVFIKARVELMDVNLYDKFRTTTRNRLCFNDGVLNIPTKEFYPWDNVPFEIFTTVAIPYDFGEYFNSPNRAVMTEVRETVFETLFHDKIQSGMHYLARALAGNNEDKNWATYMGDRNCGKGVLFDLLNYAYGKYVTDFEPNHLMYCRKQNVEEVSRKNYWMLDFEYARLAISQEIPLADGELKANGQMIKSIVSGGDIRRAKRNFDRVDTCFKPQSSLFMMGNNELVVDEADTLQHCLEFTGRVQFKSAEFIEQVKEAYPNKPEMVSMYRVKDDSVKTHKVPSREWSMATVMLLVEAWRPKSVEIPKQECDLTKGETSLEIRKDIFESFEVTNYQESYVLVKTVEECLPKWTKKQISSALEQLGCKKAKITAEKDRNKHVYRCLNIKPKVEEVEVEA